MNQILRTLETKSMQSDLMHRVLSLERRSHKWTNHKKCHQTTSRNNQRINNSSTRPMGLWTNSPSASSQSLRTIWVRWSLTTRTSLDSSVRETCINTEI